MAPLVQHELISDNKTKSEQEDEITNLSKTSDVRSSSSQNKILGIGCLIYFSYSVSIAIDSQFLSLYYESKGFEKATLGVLYSLTPLTTFLVVPIFAMMTAGVEGDESSNENKESKNGGNEKVATRLFQMICINIVGATISQISLATLNEPTFMMFSIIATGIFQSPVRPMLDGIFMEHLDNRGDFGKLRFFSILGSGVGTAAGGRLLTIIRTHDNFVLKSHQTKNFYNQHLLNFFVSKLSTGFNLLFFARLLLTIPPILFIFKLKNIVTKKIRSGGNSMSRNTQKVDMKSKNQKKLFKSILSVARDVTKISFGNRDHLFFFVCIFIAGASGGVSDAFSCKLSLIA